MHPFKEKIRFVLTALAYVVFHLRTGPDLGTVVLGTLIQMLTTAPYCIGFTYILVVIFRHYAGGVWPPWDRILRIFFTVGIIFGLFFNLYEIGERAQKKEAASKPGISAVHFLEDGNRKVPWYWA